jgi:hypothetical protein
MDKELLPWELLVAAAIILAMITVFSLVRWVFQPRPKRLPMKRIIVFVLCFGVVLYAYRFVDNFPAKFRAGVNANAASTSETPQFEELRTPRFAKSRLEVFDATVKAIEDQSGWELTSRADSEQSLQVEISTMLGIFTDQMRISFIDENGVTRVDIQSQALKGSADFGSNRRHIVELIKALEQQLGVKRQ